MARKAFFFSFFLALTLSTTVAKSQIWTALGGPKGGLVSDISIDSSGTILIGTFFGGAFESTDHGESWHARNEGLTNFHLRGSGITASNDGYVYAISDVGGMFRLRREAGEIWQRLDTTLMFGALMSVRSTASGAVLLVTGGYGILRSTDHGATWSSANTGIDISGANRIDFIATVPGYVAAVTHTSKLYVSTNDGASWTFAGTTPSRLSGLHITSNKTIFLPGNTGAIYRSTSGGATWDTVYQDPDRYDMWSVFSNPRTVDVFAWSHTGHLLTSKDNGGTWNALDSITSVGDFYPSAIDPDGRLFVGSDFDGMYRSADGGVTLDTINNGLNANLCINACVNPRGDVFAMTERYVFRSTDRGLSWVQIFSMREADGPIPNPMLCDSLGYLYVGTDDGLWRTTDNGNTWRHMFWSKDPNETVDSRGLALDSSGMLYLGSRIGLFQSLDQGFSWRELNGPWNESPEKAVNTIVEGRNGRLYWSDYDGSIFWSDDNVFTYHTAGLQGGGIEAVDRDGNMYSSNNADVLLSTDSGANWRVLKPNEGVKTHKVFSIMLDHAENAIISTDSGIYRIDHGDPGYDWHAVSDGLSTASQARWSGISRTVEDVRHNNIFYAAGRGQGMFRSTPNMGVAERRLTPGSASLAPNFPNPFSTATTIPFTVTETGPVALEVYDVTGKVISSESLGSLVPGEYQTVYHGGDLSAGSYRYVVRTSTSVSSNVMTIYH